MSESSTTRLSRRAALRGGAAAMAGAGVAGAMLTATATAQTGSATAVGPLKVRKQLLFVDKNDKQRFLWQSTKPPVILGGRTIPAEQRGGPDDGSYFIFNDENENEKGGLTVSSGGGLLSFDYPNVDALHLETVNEGNLGGSALKMRQMPDPSIPPEDLTPADAPTRVVLGTDNAGTGAALVLYDSQGRERIVLQVDADDNPSIVILDADGNPVAQLPPAAAGATAANPQLSRFMKPANPGM